MLDEYDKRVIRTFNKSAYAEYFNNLLEQENYRYDVAITPEYIDDINSSCMIVMNEEVFNTIREVNRISREKNVEIPFFLFGREEGNGIIYFHLAEYSSDNAIKYHADFKTLSKGVVEAMNNYLRDNDALHFLYDFGNQQITKFKRAVRCYGHTHPVKGGGDRFSFSDLSCVVEHALLNQYFSSGEMGSLDMLINPSGDVNFIKYESNELFESFRKYKQVYVKMNDGRVFKLPAYKNGNYEPYPIKRHSR